MVTEKQKPTARDIANEQSGARHSFSFSAFSLSAFGGRQPAPPVDLKALRHTLKNEMINVTDSAVRQLKTLLNDSAEKSGRGLRVSIAKGGCSGLQYEMALDERRA